MSGRVAATTQAIPGSVAAAAALGDLSGWDSMGLVIFIELVQNRTGVQLAVHDLRACAHPADLLELIDRSRSS